MFWLHLNNKLKSCPFCGGEALLQPDGPDDEDIVNEVGGYYVGCKKCNAKTASIEYSWDSGYTGALNAMVDAVNKWNSLDKTKADQLDNAHNEYY